MEQVLKDASLFRPEAALTAALLLVILVDSFLGRSRDAVNRVLTLAALAGALALSIGLQNSGVSQTIFSGITRSSPNSAYWPRNSVMVLA